MKKVLFLVACLVLCTLFLIGGCSEYEPISDVKPKVDIPRQAPNRSTDVVEGVFSIQFDSSVIEQLNGHLNELSIPTGIKSLDAYLHSIGAYKMRRVFPYSGKYEPRQRAENLHTWYTVWVDTAHHNNRVLRAIEDPIVKRFEPVYRPSLGEYRVVPLVQEPLRAGEPEAFFNDPLFGRQWALENRGDIGNYTDNQGEKVVSSVKGADINVLPAWTLETGSPNVIVSVVDGGIELEHVDLKEAIWVNEGEIPGNNIDDDNNGYVDDVNGYNFVDDVGTITPHDHGTHVAGIIGAKNNNGIGICGIAGGNGSPNSGVKLMSCQIFKPNPDYNPDDPDSSPDIYVQNEQSTAAAIVYGANNGAVISQNSWGYRTSYNTPMVVKEAIAYFIKYAGCVLPNSDDDNEHLEQAPDSPMKGGLVVFAAGNDFREERAYPAMEPEVVSVASFAPDFEAAWYTNFGSWVDLSAPGGSNEREGKYPKEDNMSTSSILSTLPIKNGKSVYGYMSGTSMACPQVSGVAALIVSKYGGKGFTADNLKQRLLTAIKPVSINKKNTEKYRDKLGRGYIDANRALVEIDDTEVPPTPRFFLDKVEKGYDFITLTIGVSKDSLAHLDSYRLYISSTPFRKLPSVLPENMRAVDIPSYGKSDNVTAKRVDGLQTGTPYYFAVQTFSRNGNASSVIFLPDPISTLTNTPPIVIPEMDLSNPIVIAGNDVVDIRFYIDDAEGHKCKCNISEKSTFTNIALDGNTLILTASAAALAPASYNSTLKVTDQYGAITEVEIKIKVVEDLPPRFKKKLEETFEVFLEEPFIFHFLDYIEDENTSTLSYEVMSVKEGKVTAIVQGDSLKIVPKSWGEDLVKVKVTDQHKQNIPIYLKLFVYKQKGIQVLYPSVPSGPLYLKLGKEIEGDFTIKIYNVAQKIVYQKSYNSAKDVNPEKRTLSIDVSNLLPGKYSLLLNCSKGVYQDLFYKK